ncbi:MAG: hypothetical protein ABIY46_15790 [Gemmatimonadales bacterium]
MPPWFPAVFADAAAASVADQAEARTNETDREISEHIRRVAELRATVLLVRATLAGPRNPELKMPPPDRAELPETVLLVSVTPAARRTSTRLKMPPPRLAAVLPMIVLLAIVNELPSRLAMPAPAFRATVLL